MLSLFCEGCPQAEEHKRSPHHIFKFGWKREGPEPAEGFGIERWGHQRGRACRDLGRREDRQKTRLMWLVEEMGVDAYREEVGRRMGVQLRTGFHPEVCLTQPPLDACYRQGIKFDNKGRNPGQAPPPWENLFPSCLSEQTLCSYWALPLPPVQPTVTSCGGARLNTLAAGFCCA